MRLISLVLITVLLVVQSAWAPKANAAIFEKCQLEDWDEIPTEDFDNLEFRVQFEKARKQYHDFVRCVFDTAVSDMLGSGAASGVEQRDQGFTAAAPNFPDLLKPELACLTEERLTDLLTDSSPANILDVLLLSYNSYVTHLNALVNQLDRFPTVSGATVEDFPELLRQNSSLKLIVENEIQNALVALDTSFIALKEMRQAFVMHVHFQCMLKNLEAYRRTLESLREVISVIPGLIEDASTHK